ncbi:hypothetical protein R1flu_013415 [Riccia fluitans]|uniref:Uncharacterized protein n=1 Tax=Riccia fluitans TaxID=41844 RepID=A0ABD1YD60_9MARC
MEHHDFAPVVMQTPSPSIANGNSIRARDLLIHTRRNPRGARGESIEPTTADGFRTHSWAGGNTFAELPWNASPSPLPLISARPGWHLHDGVFERSAEMLMVTHEVSQAQEGHLGADLAVQADSAAQALGRGSPRASGSKSRTSDGSEEH